MKTLGILVTVNIVLCMSQKEKQKMDSWSLSGRLNVKFQNKMADQFWKWTKEWNPFGFLFQQIRSYGRAIIGPVIAIYLCVATTSSLSPRKYQSENIILLSSNCFFMLPFYAMFNKPNCSMPFGSYSHRLFVKENFNWAADLTGRKLHAPFILCQVDSKGSFRPIKLGVFPINRRWVSMGPLPKIFHVWQLMRSTF